MTEIVPKITISEGEVNDCLVEACKTDNVNYARLALASGADANATTKYERTPLHWAVEARSINTVALLIANGANVNARCNDFKSSAGSTPLDLAVVNGYSDIAAVLKIAAQKQGHTARIDGERKDKGPPQVGG